ncbi:hypothetical protein DKL61_09150 [Gammaproteobacteria bacterium ESL0073]|nr:hypothetical protein DKL61_09150 [Gammaproteobacteria bacterium ESL0073]
MSDLTDLYTTEAIQNMTLVWFGRKMDVNDKVVLLTYEVIEKGGSCTISIDMVPYKLGGVTGVVGKLSSIAIATIKRVVQHAGKDQHYIMCTKSIARDYRTRFEEASSGL